MDPNELIGTSKQAALARLGFTSWLSPLALGRAQSIYLKFKKKTSQKFKKNCTITWKFSQKKKKKMVIPYHKKFEIFNITI